MDSTDLFDLRISDFFEAAKRGTGGVARPMRLVEAALFQRRQAKRRKEAARRGMTVPPILIASLTRRCNLQCEGCYSRALRPPQPAGSEGSPESSIGTELSDERFMELFNEAIDMGVGTMLLAGGEPLIRRKLVEEASKLKGILLPLFTNGTLIDKAFMETVAQGSIVPIFSIEGEEKETDGRRGEGIHAGASRWMEAMKKRGMMFGASVTLTSKNSRTVLDPAFLEKLGATGIAVLFIIEYVPVSPGTDDLVVGAEERATLGDIEGLAGLPFPVVALPGDEEAYGGCLAAGRGFVHLSPEGRIEACPFAPFSDRDVATGSLEQALKSPMLAAIRERHGELTETKGGCALWNRGGWIASLSGCPPAKESGSGKGNA
ncbi:MAG TPA: radical SAM/SPASM domain-containing protein [Rectinemataceae bacterium]|nr:radical SAM/SPASM domain-containing protein [Rectinemataceae bacterium]